jgi:hypothetical protein
MSKNTPTSQIRKNLYLIIIGAIALVASVISITTWYQLNYSTELLVHANTITNHEHEYSYNKLLFCYDRNIRPCTDETVSMWNAQHGDDAFTLKSVKQLGQEVKF